MRLFYLVLVLALGACTYDEETAKLLLHATYASFCDRELESWTCFPCTQSFKMDRVVIIKSGSEEVFGYFGYEDSTHSLYVIVRGTTEIESRKSTSAYSKEQAAYKGNFIKDNECAGCTVNAKMMELANQIYPEVLEAMKNGRLGQNWNIHVAGYGMGAGILTILLSYLHYEKVYINSFYTFGSPRVGNYLFSTWFDELQGMPKSNRITHHGDAVARYGSTLFSKFFTKKAYKHIQHEIYYPKNGKYKECKDFKEEDNSCSAGVLFRSWDAHFTYFDTNFNIEIALCSGTSNPT